MTTYGVLLAAGAGQRYGQPKALVARWLEQAVDGLLEGGCSEVVVVLGAEAERARMLLPADPRARSVVAEQWAEGMGASLRAGLAVVPADVEAVMLHLVDLPDVGADVVRRILVGREPDSLPGTATLRRATYAGVPGHPVVLGRDHWAGVIDVAVGDRGAREYLSLHQVELVECGDLATGRDVDQVVG